MKTKDCSRRFKNLKAEARTWAAKVSFAKMIIDSITPPDGWKVEFQESWGDISLTPVEENDKNITADVFDRVVSKFAKGFNSQPSMYITEQRLEADICLYRSRVFSEWRNNYDFYVRIEIKTSNTEKCEIVYKRKMHKVAELTGYCKVLSEKKYLEVSR